MEDFTAVARPDGQCALFEFTGALPRAKLYAHWLATTNDQAVLDALGSKDFDPAQTVYVDESAGSGQLRTSDFPLLPAPSSQLPAPSSNTVEFVSYAPKRLIFKTSAPEPTILLLNDRYDPNWQVFVDGQPAPLLRCNYIMRGVQLPPGAHQVEFHFQLPPGLRNVTVAAILFGLLLSAFLAVYTRFSTGREAATAGG